MKYYFLMSDRGHLFFNFIFFNGKIIRLENTRKSTDSILYTLSDAKFYSTLLNEKKHSKVWIMQKEFYKHYKTLKPNKNEQTDREQKKSIVKNSISGYPGN